MNKEEYKMIGELAKCLAKVSIHSREISDEENDILWDISDYFKCKAEDNEEEECPIY